MDSHGQKLLKLIQHFADALTVLGMDLTDPSLADTPIRMAKAYYNELCGGMTGVIPYPSMTTFPAPEESGIVVVENIPFSTLCEHHMLPFFGKATIAYLPDKLLLGLSKFPRIVEYLSAKPQVQERFTYEIAKELEKVIGPNVYVKVEAEHSCMCARGIKARGSTTKYSYIGGLFSSSAQFRDELYQSLGKK